MNSATSQVMRNIQHAEAASKKTSVGNGLATAKSFIQKKWEESQRVGIVPGGFSSNHDSKKPSSGTLWRTSGEAGVSSIAGKPPKTAPETPKPTIKPGSTAGADKPAGSKPSSSNKDTDGSSAKPKDATPKPESSKSNPVNNKTPNEVNIWKPSSTKDKDVSKPKEDTKPPKQQDNQNDAKPKENQEGPEGTGQDSQTSIEQNFILFNKTHKNAAPKPRGKGPNGGRLESHHGLQGEWAKENLTQYGYDYKEAPTVTLETGKGHPHTTLTNLQNNRRDERVAEGKGKWSSTLQEELINIVKDFKEIGFTRKTIEKILEQQYKMLDKLKVPYRRIDLDEYF
ncbi:hypothetical protein JNUCC31_05495 [Paenibacillus sp. JNUCC31]|nr:hypothetical protein JNUCC31_05495 [Paenibacillus sp. JNUCC-31]